MISRGLQDWDSALTSILQGPIHRALILGPTDARKSSFALALIQAALGHGKGAALIDADLGQKMVGPPAAVTLAWGDAPEVLAGLAFVGTTDPTAGATPLIAGLGRLSRETPGKLLVVNSSGPLSGPRRWFKSAKIAVLEPDLLVALGEDPALDSILADHPQVAALRLPSSLKARRKGPGTRRAAGRGSFRRHLEGSPLHEISLPPGGPPLSERQLVGLVDLAGRDLALGLVEALDSLDHRAWVRSPARAEAVCSLVPGQLRLDERYDAWRL